MDANKLHLNEHISQQFNLELEDIRNKAMVMGGLVEKQVSVLRERNIDMRHRLNALTNNAPRQRSWWANPTTQRSSRFVPLR